MAGELEEDVIEARTPERHSVHRRRQVAHQARNEDLGVGHLHPQAAVIAHRRDTEQSLDLGRRIVGLARCDGDDVATNHRLELVGRAEGHDLAAVDDGDAIAVLSLIHVVRGHEDRDALRVAQLVEVSPDALASLRIKSQRGLVQEQNLWLVKHPPRDLQTALHPA